jgi:hypothetical protein
VAVVVEEIEVVDTAPREAAAAPAAAPPAPGRTDQEIADVAERAWRRVAALQERVRAD